MYFSLQHVIQTDVYICKILTSPAFHYLDVVRWQNPVQRICESISNETIAHWTGVRLKPPYDDLLQLYILYFWFTILI